MIVEVLELLKGHLSDGTNGAAVKIAAMPRRSGDSAPTALTGVFEETSDEAVGAQNVPATLPALGLSARLSGLRPDQAINTEGSGEISVLIRYLVANVDSDSAKAEASYSVRGVLKSLAVFFAGAGDANRALRSVQIINVTSITVLPMYQPLGDGFVSWAMEVTMTYRDYL